VQHFGGEIAEIARGEVGGLVDEKIQIGWQRLIARRVAVSPRPAATPRDVFSPPPPAQS
jgi:hypothetical protein